jgi:FtsP/CotA-like multicopper oxidase with cupredoxin domain
MQAESFKLRMINTGFEMLSAVTRLDGRKFNITATDGRDLEPMTGDVLVLGVGETYDIMVPISQDQQGVILRFWIPVDHIGKTDDNDPHQPFVDIEFNRDASIQEGEFKTELFMRKPEDKIAKNDHENSVDKSIWLNCPGPKKGIICKTVSDFKRLESSDYKFESEMSTNTPANVSPLDEPDVIHNIHVNFMTQSSINGIHFKYPTAPLFNGTDSDEITKCTKEDLAGAGGFCTQVKKL